MTSSPPVAFARVLAVMASLVLAPREGMAQDTAGFARPDTSFAYTTAYKATVFGMPLLGMYERLTQEVLDGATRKAPFDAFYHYRALATPSVAPFPAPNNDTLYSTAWLDLRQGAVILEAPDTGGRYYTAQVLDMATETLANIGQRVDSTGAGRFAIVGPGWEGSLPAGVTRVVRCPTSFAYVLLRILVDGPADVPAVNVLQNKFSLKALPAPRAPPRRTRRRSLHTGPRTRENGSTCSTA